MQQQQQQRECEINGVQRRTVLRVRMLCGAGTGPNHTTDWAETGPTQIMPPNVRVGSGFNLLLLRA